MNDGSDTMTAAEFNALQAGGTSERAEHEALVKWCAAKEAERPALRLLFHVPNGGHRTARAGARMKKLGAKRGVPDLCLPVMRLDAGGQLCGALWIEMKSGKGQLRKRQRWWRDRLKEAGHAHAVCRSWIEARDTIVSYLNGCFQPTPRGTAQDRMESACKQDRT